MDRLIGCHQFLTSPHLKEWLKKQGINFLLYGVRVDELKVAVQKLEKKSDVIQRTVNEELRHDREIHDEVKEWIKKANELISDYEDFNKEEFDHKCAVVDLFVSGYLPKPGIRYRRSRKAYDITKKANESVEKSKFESFSYWSGPPSMAAFFSNVGYKAINREKAKRKKLWKN
ncbi:hypothetical protein VNO78_16325 [Psophocarpus tetragonolobus]|uniref:Uncharacterized protein n=1 Tax=Psophocarpus tetragonolobus TaxID=3891 RepID=A0AAN9XKP5_PSOTE